MKWILIPFFSLFTVFSYAADTLSIFINLGQHTLVDGDTISCKAFNSASSFTFGANLFKTSSDPVVLQIVNNDSISHVVKLESVFSENVASGNTIYKSLAISTGKYKLYSDNQHQKYLGLSGLLIVEDDKPQSFFWNIKEFQTSFNEDLAIGNAVDFNSYKPNYFLINGNSNPDIGTDSLAHIVGSVGDTLIVNILNSGNSIHSLHFHGYHFTILHSSRQSKVEGWEKDTYGVYPNELLVIQIVPHQPGEYPIHDHNLVATTANNIYPSGMFTTMVISE